MISVTIDMPTSTATIPLAEGNPSPEISQAVGASVFALTRKHVRQIGLNRHATANRLGAQPTKFFSEAAKTCKWGSDATAAYIYLYSPGFANTFGDVTIRPTGGRRYLTIPIHALAYGKTVYELARRVKIFRPYKKGSSTERADYLAGKQRKDGKAIPLFALVRQVTQLQDRSKLPSDADYNTAAERGITNYLKAQNK